MTRPKPWWTTYPRKHWTAEGWRAARKAGVVPPPPQPDLDPAIALLAMTTPKAATLPGGLWGDPEANRDAERRRKANQVLEKHGLRPRPW